MLDAAAVRASMADLDSFEYARPPLLASISDRSGYLFLQSTVERNPALVADADQTSTYLLALLVSGRAPLRAFVFPR